jgi:hypothetical protein
MAALKTAIATGCAELFERLETPTAIDPSLPFVLSFAVLFGAK